MYFKNERVLEISLLFILVFQTLRSHSALSSSALVLITIFVLIFILFSLFDSKLKIANIIRFLSLFSLAVSIFSLIFLKAIFERQNSLDKINVNDGMIMTEFGTKSLLAGKNPYSISYLEAVKKEKSQAGQKNYEIEELKHFQYSPVILWLSVSFFLVSQNLFNFFDLRIVLVSLFFISALIGYLLTNRSVLFLIIFLFNPVFLSSLTTGANDVVPLFFLFLCLMFLKLSKISVATVALTFAVGSKLIALPFAPIYFIYLIRTKGMGRKEIFVQFVIFLVSSLAIYLPFAVWNIGDFVSDLVIYQVAGGSVGKPIAGFLGLPQLLNTLGIISKDSTFPFFILFVPIYLAFLRFFWRLMGKSRNLTSLTLGYFFAFLIFVSFTRIVQTTYLDYISQFLILAAFYSDVDVKNLPGSTNRR